MVEIPHECISGTAYERQIANREPKEKVEKCPIAFKGKSVNTAEPICHARHE